MLKPNVRPFALPKENALIFCVDPDADTLTPLIKPAVDGAVYDADICVPLMPNDIPLALENPIAVTSDDAPGTVMPTP